ncbi:hypothetical protein ACIQM0_19915 [Streptomyces sp. NPDC091387]|uniref:hypothetical protein n=1 Tax=Streptomyces sp. NPDC091387 TaxID=3365998 RepID=UPI003819057A
MNTSATIRSLATRWTVVVPLVAAVALILSWGREPSPFAVAVMALCLAGAVLAAVHHSEVIAHRVGEPSGPRAASASRPASTSHSAPRWPASA